MTADPQPTPSADRRAALVAACLLAAIAGFYLARGMPWVNVDDVFFANAGIDLARTGQLVNHAIDPWLAGFHTDKYYVQLPFPAYSLAGWVRLFGANTRSFIGFEWVCYLVGGYGLVRVLARFGLPLGARLLLATIYLTLLVQTGFRPEAEASALLFLGLSLVDTAAPFRQKLAALLLIGFSVLTYAMTLALAVPFTVALWWLQRAPDATVRTWPRETVHAWRWPVAVAVTVVLLTFLAMIHFDLARFVAVFNAHRRMRASPESGGGGFFHLVTEHEEWLLTLPLVLLLPVAGVVVAACWRRVEAPLRLLVGACVAAAVGCIVLYPAKAIMWVVLLAFCAGCALAAGQLLRRFRWLAVLALAGWFAGSESLWIVSASQRRFPDAAVLRADRDAALRAGKDLVVDASTARYVFDFQLPERTLALGYTQPWSGVPPLTLARRAPNSYWIVTAPIMTTWLYDLPPSYDAYPRMHLGHHPFHSLPLTPDDPVVIP